MGALFGHTWASQYGVNPNGVSGDTWSAALAGLTGEQIANGLRETLMLGAEFPPAAPRFRSLCLGIPSFATLRYEIAHGDEGHTPFGLLCWQKVDVYALRRADQATSDRLIRDAYELAKAHVMAGGALPEVHPVLAAPDPKPEKRTPADPETALRHLAEIDEILGPKPSAESEIAETCQQEVEQCQA